MGAVKTGVLAAPGPSFEEYVAARGDWLHHTAWLLTGATVARALDFANAVTLQGFLIPALSQRKAETEIFDHGWMKPMG